jgi:hypothetical protein
MSCLQRSGTRRRAALALRRFDRDPQRYLAKANHLRASTWAQKEQWHRSLLKRGCSPDYAENALEYVGW